MSYINKVKQWEATRKKRVAVIRRMLSDGKNFEEIGAALGLTRQRVSAIAHKEGLK